MKLLIIRHGDPDYEHDSLTEKGWREAEYLSERLVKINPDYFYVSPYGRAQDTAKPTLSKLKKEAETCKWLREFEASIHRPDVTDRRIIPWDWLPQDWMAEERFFRMDEWDQNERMAEGEVKKEYDWVIENLDALLLKHGYKRNGRGYLAEKANNDTIVFFCHFGVQCVLLSHLLNISPVLLWHGMAAAPSSVTTVVSEERRKGTASFRMTAFGDQSHLYAKDEEPSFQCRFCETYENDWQRHD